jgi:hypothetical protein
MCCDDRGCGNPEKLEGKPEDCSEKQVRECHGEGGSHGCEESGCERPEKLTGRPADCPEERVRECHGDSAAHPCE